MGGDPVRHREDVSEEELRDMVAAQPTFTPQQRRIIEGAFEVAERTLQEVLRPRREVFVLDADASASAALESLAGSGHSRAPVGVRSGLDDVIGVVHLRDLLCDGDRSLRDLAAPLCVMPESVGVLDALRTLQARREQMALVVDEYGSTTGIVTVEDLVEEVVGEIYDETDRDLVAVRHDSDGAIVLAGGFPVHDLPDLGIFDMPDGAYATVAGLVLDQLGRIPDRAGDRVSVGDWIFEVTAIDRHAITELRVRAASRPPG
jgi:putative hemolysin